MTAISTSKNMTIAGILSLVGALATALVPLFDNDPTTTINWAAVAALVITGVIGILGKGAASTGGTVPETPEAKARVG
jgi:hypothetical protein